MNRQDISKLILGGLIGALISGWASLLLAGGRFNNIEQRLTRIEDVMCAMPQNSLNRACR